MYATDTEVGFFPQDDGGSYKIYYCDYGVVYSSHFPFVGGNYSDTSGIAGPFYVYFGSYASSTTRAVRLSFKEGEA